MEPSDPDLRAWIGRSETLRDTIVPTPVAALSATLDQRAAPVEAGMALAPLWHWLYFLPLRRQSEIGAVTEVEGYPGLIVHRPLIATLLMDLLQREKPGAEVASFRFKALRPTFDLHPFHVNGAPQADGKTVRLWGSDHEGWLTMDATATLR